MSSAAAATSQAPVSAPTTAAQSAPAPATSSAAPTSASQAQTTTPQTTAAPTSSSSPAANSSSSSTSSNAAASSATSATSSSTTQSRSSSSSSSSSSSRASLTSSISYVVQTSDGQVFTQTSVVTLPASSPSESSQSGQSSPSFFHNTGAVAGVFSVVGIIGLVLVFLLFTSYIRRRRARKLDREIDEAAAAAANAQAPDFDDFDYTSGTGIGYGQYSETSHGTYNQPPLSHERSRNNLNDIPSFDTYNNTGGAGSGAAGVGARGRSLRGGGMQDPFGALANPPEQYEMTESRQSWNQGSLRGGAEVTTYDMLHAAGLSGSDPYAVTRAPSTRLGKNPSLSGLNVLTRRQSQGTTTLPTTAENYPMPTAAPAYPGGQDGPYLPEKARYSGSHATPAAGDADVYGGYQDQPSASLDNPHSPGLPGPRAQDELEDVAEQFEPGPHPHVHEEPARASLADDEDYGYNVGNRVLRVANE